jgi:TatD DNase family protein
VKLVDAHCHLDDFEDREEVLARAQAAGVAYLIVNGLWKAAGDFGVALDFARSHPQQASATVAIHPEDCERAKPSEWEDCRQRAADPQIVAVGETGLDYHYDSSTPGSQQAALRASIAIARAVRKPLVLHVREADEDCARILKEEGASEVGGQIHCFTGDRAAARVYLDLGFHVSFTGILTFKNAEEIREAAKLVPIDRLLVETDSPYLAPVPHRGKRNEPAFVVETAKKLAELRGIGLEELAQATTRNAARLFGIRALGG